MLDLLNYNQNIVYSLVMMLIHVSFEHIFLLDVYFLLMNFLPLFDWNRFKYYKKEGEKKPRLSRENIIYLQSVFSLFNLC